MLKRTPLHDRHLALGAKMVPYAGWEMPVHYPAGINAEHRAVRENAGIFDVSHMGEFEVKGPGAVEFIRSVAVNDAGAATVGRAQYSALCTEEGGVMDDLLVYPLEDRWMLVVNASNREKDFAWLKSRAEGHDIEFTDISDRTGLIAIQGPKAEEILAPLLDDVDPGALGYYRFAEGTVAGVRGIVSRTGYTGEDGFELYLPWYETAAVWDRLMEESPRTGLVPAGLGARDSLRLEMGYPLYGNELDSDHSPLEAGLGWIVKLEGREFVGSEVLRAQKEAGLTRRLVGLRLTGKGFPRGGYPVERDGREIGALTSGILSPTLGVGIALAWVEADASKPGTELGVKIRDRLIPAEVVRPPFHTEGSIRR